MNKILVLFTSSYPYQGGEQFIETEINYLANSFKKIIIVPSKKNDKIRSVPTNVIVDNFVANSNKSIGNRLLALFSREFLKYLSFNSNQNRYWAINIFYVLKYQKWLESYIQNNDIQETIFYTYWFGASTTALSITKQKNSDVKFITRTHGGDLYENVHKFNFFPSRKDVIKNIDKIFSISENGKRHIIQKYKIDENKIKISRLGIKPHGLLSRKLDNGVLKIVSCSSLIEVKRVILIVKSLSLLKNSDIKIQWTHIGDGILMSDIKKLAEESLKNNIEYNFVGFVANKQIYEFYANNPIDIFINVSSSEGVPVSIMEAQSFGIPCIATDVGGTSEIVNNKNGYLLDANPEPKKIAKIFEDLFNNRDKLLTKSKLSFENWSRYYNADDNYKNFLKSILSI